MMGESNRAVDRDVGAGLFRSDRDIKKDHGRLKDAHADDFFNEILFGNHCQSPSIISAMKIQ